MDKQIVTTLITGIFSLLTALGSVWLKDLLERRRLVPVQKPTAVQEPSEEKVKHPPPVMVSGWTWKRPLFVFFGAFVFGLFTRALRPLFGGGIHWETLIAVLVLASASLWMAIDHRRARSSFWPYELEVLALWLAWASGWSVIHGSAWSDHIVVSCLWWLGCAVISGIVVSIHTRKMTT